MPTPEPPADLPTAPSEALPRRPLALALFLLSTATVLFTLAIFKLLSFFIMPSLFFDLLFVGFPIGAFIGARFFRVTPSSFRSTLWLLQGVMALSIVAALFCKEFDYLRANLFEVRLDRLIGQIGTFTGFFVPFFCAYGLSEYLGYQVGRQNLKGRMPLVYALYLFGAAFAYVFLKLFLSDFEVSRVLCLSIGLIALSAALLTPKGWRRALLWCETALLFFLALPLHLVMPDAEWTRGVEAAFLKQYKGDNFQSTADYSKRGYEFAFQEWGDYSLTEIMVSYEMRPDPETGVPRREIREFAGFYNDLMQWEYSPEHGFTERSLGMIPINLAPEEGRIAIIGSGGGRQVRWAQRDGFNFETIVGLELEPAVFRAVREKLRDEFANVYEADNVLPIRHEARGFMESTDETFDLIYLPSVGGYPQMMLEPGNMIRTVDAYETLRDRLSDRGILAVWYPSGLDPQGILTDQYVRTLRSPKVGLKTKAYFNAQEYLILAARDPQASLPTSAQLDAILMAPSDNETPDLPPNPLARCGPWFVAEDTEFYTPITDEQPFLAGNVRHIFSLEQVYWLFGLSAGLLVVIGVVAVFYLRKRGDPEIPGRNYWQVVGMSALFGMNFLLFEHYLILALFKKLYVFHDALVLGAISFLILSGLGSVLITRRLLPICVGFGVACCLALIFLQPFLPAAAVIALVAPVAFVTGSLFPTLFERAAHNPLGVFAMDAIGAALGSMLAFFLPIAFGFQVFFPVGAGVFIVTCAATLLFFRAVPAEQPATVNVAAAEDATEGATA